VGDSVGVGVGSGVREGVAVPAGDGVNVGAGDVGGGPPGVGVVPSAMGRPLSTALSEITMTAQTAVTAVIAMAFLTMSGSF
jgi:hypothetical protein